MSAAVPIVAQPGLLTDQQAPYDLAKLVGHGFTWLAFQAQNDTKTVDVDLAPAKDAGLAAGVWGVTYSQAAFRRDGALLGKQALDLGAQFVLADAEECLKNTRDGGASPLIAGIRDGGWSGPVHLTTLGAPANWSVNDFAMDTASFLATGGGVFPQAYVNEASEYLPDYCARYWTRQGVDVPADRLNVMIALYSGRLGRINGASWVTMLDAARVRRNFSVYMAQHGSELDYEALEILAKGPPSPPPPPAPASASELRKQIAKLAADWERTAPVSTRRSRLGVTRRIVGPTSTDQRWSTVSGDIALLLDKAGIA